MTNVVVVGAGLAGLTAATDLADKGIDVTVLEARTRAGGRTHGVQIAPGQWVDAGAAYLGDRHTALLASLERTGLGTTPTVMVGASRFSLRPGVESTSGRFPSLSAVALGELFELLDALANSVNADAPWLTPDAPYLDSISAARWAEENLSYADARTFFPLFLGEMMAADPHTVSVLHMAFYLQSGGGLRYLNAFEGGAQQDRVTGGAHGLADALAAALGDRVRYDEPVEAIHGATDSVTVVSAKGTWQADAVIVAVPPLLADVINFLPPLSAPRAGDRTGRGCAVKVHLIYSAPLWREHGLSGWSMSAAGPLLSTVDDSPSDGVGVLTGFVTGAEAHRYSALTYAEQREEALAQADRKSVV